MAIPVIYKLDFLIERFKAESSQSIEFQNILQIKNNNKKYSKTYSKYSIIQKASRKLTDEELIVAVSGIVKKSHDWGLQDIRKFCKQIYGATLPREKKLDYIISRLLHHLRPVPEVLKFSDVQDGNCLKNKYINHVDPENAPFKKDAIAVKSLLQSIAKPVTSKGPATSQSRNKRTPKNMTSKCPATSQSRNKRTPKNMCTTCIKGMVQNSEHKLLAGTKIEIFALKKKIDETYTSESGEYVLEIKMILNRKYRVSASMKDYASVKQEIVLNKLEKVKIVNFNLVSQKTYTVYIKGLVQNAERELLEGAFIEFFAVEKKLGAIYTSKSGEYTLKMKMKLNKSYHVSASKVEYATVKEEIMLKNEQEKEIIVNFNLAPQKTHRANKSDHLIKNIGDLLVCGFDPGKVMAAVDPNCFELTLKKLIT